MQGEVKKIKEIKDRLTSTAGVKHSDLMITNPTNY